MTTDQVLSAKYHAHSLHNHALLAHFCEGPYAKAYRKARMHEDFLKLADEMGYDVMLRSAEKQTEDEAA
jgi:hypothetical protein